MPTKYTPPAISVVLQDDDTYRLMATSHSFTEPAGERLFRTPPHPEIKFVHDTAGAANKDARTLRDYLDQCASGKRSESAEAGRGWWQD